LHLIQPGWGKVLVILGSVGQRHHRSQFYKDITLPFYGFNRAGAAVSEGIRENWWRQGMMGAIKAQY
jgi:non-heme chloroperoxidase